MVSKPAGQIETGHGRAEEGRGNRQSLRHTEVFPGKRPFLLDAQEETDRVGRRKIRRKISSSIKKKNSIEIKSGVNEPV